MAEAASFPRRHARTRGFTLGRPRGFRVAEDGSRVAFLRSLHGEDPVNRLWVLDLASGRERLVADPAELLGDAGEQLTAAERTRRERARERAGGVVAYATDRALRSAAFALGGRLFLADLTGGGGVRELPTAGPAHDPRPDPPGRRVAYVTGGALHVTEPGGADVCVAAPDGPEVTWGLAEFIAAEEMGRQRGYWWAPDGERLAVARVDLHGVGCWWLADAADPAAPPSRLAYPAAGGANADVRLFLAGADGQASVEVGWDRQAFPYLVSVCWAAPGPTLLVQSRDQRVLRVLLADPASGATTVIHQAVDDAWLEIVPGVPAWLPDGRLVFTADTPATRRLTLAGEPCTPEGLQLVAVSAVGDAGVLLAATDEPAEQHVFRLQPDGELRRLSREPGVHGAVGAGEVVVLTSATLERDGTRTVVLRGAAGEPAEPIAEIRSVAAASGLAPNPRLLRAGPLELRTALLLPSEPADGPWPVLLDPYGGPHALRVQACRGDYLTAQWFAAQGFAVLIADGRGTPARGPAWERAVAGDLAAAPLDDQVAALHAAAAAEPRLDLSRVAIRGWSFGGYLAALAVLRRPEVFHAAVAGAPVTDWRLYDTHYTERYLGRPDTAPAAYRRSSLLDDAARLRRPLLLIHGLADDNVVAAHTLRLSAALLAAGRPHSVLPLSGVTHMTPQEVVAENLLLLQLAFLTEALARPGGRCPA